MRVHKGKGREGEREPVTRVRSVPAPSSPDVRERGPRDEGRGGELGDAGGGEERWLGLTLAVNQKSSSRYSNERGKRSAK